MYTIYVQQKGIGIKAVYGGSDQNADSEHQSKFLPNANSMPQNNIS